MDHGAGGAGPFGPDPLITPAAVRAVLAALWQEVARPVWRLLSGGLTQAVVLRNAPTCGVLAAAYAAAVWTALR